jgi:hypothetical protein
LKTKNTKNKGKRNDDDDEDSSNNNKEIKRVRVAVRGGSFIFVVLIGTFTAAPCSWMYPLVLTVKVGWLQGAA